jgi:hypothetical protein
MLSAVIVAYMAITGVRSRIDGSQRNDYMKYGRWCYRSSYQHGNVCGRKMMETEQNIFPRILRGVLWADFGVDSSGFWQKNITFPLSKVLLREACAV